MSKKAAVPDAWDDDWEAQADKADAAPEIAKAKEIVRVTKAERLAKHAETNRKIWESAEEPETFHFLAARDNIPLKTEFKPQLKVLSRKPAPKAVQRLDHVTGLAKMSIEDEDDDDDEQKKDQPTPEELRLRAQREREEKQKRYDEARARILGTKSGSSTPGTITPPTEDGKVTRGKGRARGSGRQESSRTDSQPGHKELFDPTYTPKPGFTLQKRGGDTGKASSRNEEQVIRAPRGPDGSGRGGFGFANRRGKMG